MASGEVILNGTVIDDGGSSSHSSAANIFDGNALTVWQTNPGAGTGWVGVNAGAPCIPTRFRASPLGGYPDAMLGGFFQGSTSTTFPAATGFQQANGRGINSANQSSITSVFTLAQSASNCNVVWVSLETPSAVIGSVTDTAGNTYNPVLSPANGTNIYCYIALNISSSLANANTVTVSFSTHGDFPGIFIEEYSGIPSSSAFDVGSQNSGTGTTPNSGSFTTTNASDIILSMVASVLRPNITPGSGFISRLNLSPLWASVLEEKTVNSVGTYNASFNINSSLSWQCAAIAIKSTGRPNTVLTISDRPNTGTLLNEYSINTSTPFQYWRYAASANSNGYVGDIDFIVEYVPGVVAMAAAPTISPAGRTFDLPILVTLSCITTDAIIYYTIDGSTPTASSNQYTTPFAITSSCTFKAIAISAGISNSRITTTNFNIGSSFNSLQRLQDDRSYPIQTFTPHIFQDSVSGYWYMFITNSDEIGVTVNGWVGTNIYRSADLRNWSYRATMQQPPSGQALNYNAYQYRPFVFYSQANGYVMWTIEHPSAHLVCYTASSIEGPWNLFASYTGFNGYTCTGDFCGFLDSDGVSGYLIYDSGTQAVFVKLNSALNNWDGNTGTGHFANYTTSTTFGVAPPDGGGGLNLDGPHMFLVGSSYFLLCNAQNQWAPTLNSVAVATAPMGPWTNLGNPAVQQPGAGNGSPDWTLFYGSQNNYVFHIPGRGALALIMTCDAYNLGLSGSQGTSTTANFVNDTIFFLPIAFPTPSSISISWNPSWSLDSVFPTVSGAPVSPGGLIIDSGVAAWSNNEPLPADVYLDTASDPSFTVNAVSQFVSPGSSSANVLMPNRYHRIRAVNANGSSVSQIFHVVVPSFYSPGGLSASELSSIQRKWNERNTSPNLPTPVN